MFLYAQASGGSPQGGGGYSMLLVMAIIFAIFYFLIIMPAKKKQKSHQHLIASLKGGEKVVTSGGIYGTVTRVLEDRVEIDVDKNTKLQIAKSSISAVIPPEGAPPPKK